MPQQLHVKIHVLAEAILPMELDRGIEAGSFLGDVGPLQWGNFVLRTPLGFA